MSMETESNRGERSTRVLAPGIYDDLTMSEYFAIEAVSRSKVLAALRSPAHFKAYAEDDRDSEALTIGSAVHCAVLTPELFDRQYVECGLDQRTKAFKEWRGAAPPGAIVLKPDAVAMIRAIANRVRSLGLGEDEFPMHRVLAAGNAERTLVWNDRETGILCKGRVDWQHQDLLVDLKTAADASWDAAQKAAVNYQFHIQAPFYIDGARALGLKISGFVFLMVEKTPPYECAIYSLDKVALDAGRGLYQQALGVIANCERAQKWPGYPKVVQNLWLPPWA
jgi:hypothetical protein